MRVITIQHPIVIKALKENGIYYVSNNAPISLTSVKPYQFMMEHYKYQHRPIFMCPVGYYCNFYGADTENSYIVELEIPDKYCNIQEYYCWTDFIYFTEYPNEFKEFNEIKTVEQLGKYVLDMNKYGFNSGKKACYQVTTQFLRKNWIRQIIKMNETFDKLYVGNGGGTILQSITKGDKIMNIEYVTQDFIDQYALLITDNICIMHGVDPKDAKSRAILSYTLSNVNNDQGNVGVDSDSVTQTLIFGYVNLNYWDTITYTNSNGSIVTEKFTNTNLQSYQVVSGTNVKLSGKDSTLDLYVYGDLSSSTDGGINKGRSAGCQFIMPSSSLLMYLDGYSVRVDSGSVEIEALPPTQTLTLELVYPSYWKSITYTDSTGSIITEPFSGSAGDICTYQVIQGTNVKLNGNNGIHTLHTDSEDGTCINGEGRKGKSIGCQFTMPFTSLSMDLDCDDDSGDYNVYINSGSVVLEPLLPLVTQTQIQTLTITSITPYWNLITYTDATGSIVTETLSEKSYQIVQGTTVKLNNKSNAPRKLYTYSDGGICTNGVGKKSYSNGCQFIMPSSSLTLGLSDRESSEHCSVKVKSGSVAIEILPPAEQTITAPLTIKYVDNNFWYSITYTNSHGSTITDQLSEKSYEVTQDTTVKLNGSGGTSRPLRIYTDGGTCTYEKDGKDRSIGCKFKMPATPLSLQLDTDFYEQEYIVTVNSGSVTLNPL